jgi:hypothetical protein
MVPTSRAGAAASARSSGPGSLRPSRSSTRRLADSGRWPALTAGGTPLRMLVRRPAAATPFPQAHIAPHGSCARSSTSGSTRHRALRDTCAGYDLLALGGGAEGCTAAEYAPIPILIARLCPLGMEVTDTVVACVDESLREQTGGGARRASSHRWWCSGPATARERRKSALIAGAIGCSVLVVPAPEPTRTPTASGADS